MTKSSGSMFAGECQPEVRGAGTEPRTPEMLIAYAESLGVSFTADAGRLRVNAPLGTLTEELKSSIAGAKEALLRLLERRAVAHSAAIERVDHARPLPVSSFQERLWILQRLYPENVAYNIGHAWRSSAPVNAVVAAIRSLLARHEILRSGFDDLHGALTGHVLGVDSVPVEVRDLSALPSSDWHARIAKEMQAEVSRPFDLVTAAPVRFSVYRLSDALTAVVMVAHHIAVDDWSINLIEQEINAGAATNATPPPAPRLQYADYAAWQLGALDANVIASELEWWGRYLAHAPQLSVFPPDVHADGATAPAVGAGATQRFVWDAEVATSLRALAAKEGATLYMTLMAAAAVVLRWHTGQEDFVLGSPLGTRERTELETMIGPFVNLLLVRLELSGNPTFTQLLRQARDTLLEAYEHRHVPFEMLLDRLRPARTLEHSPLFQVAIVEHNAREMGDAAARFNGGSMHELTWFVRNTPAGLECLFEYRQDLYSQGAIERIAAHLEMVLRRAAADPERRLSELPLLSGAERAQLEKFNATARRLEPTTFISEFERQVALSPGKVALAHLGNEFTYADLNQRANRLAHLLRASGVTRGVRAAVCLERSASLLIALLSVQKAGGTYVPLDPGFPSQRLSYMLEDSGATVLLAATSAASGLQVPERVVRIDPDACGAEHYPSDNPESLRQPGDPVYLIYTSGSTGLPKGVLISQGALLNLLYSMQETPGLAPTDVLAAVTTVSFDIAALEIYLPLMVGARVELVPREIAADGAALAALLADREVTVLQATPATWRLLVEAGWQGSARLRALCGGESLQRELADSLLERCAQLWNLYGPTETTVWSTVERVEREGPITVGRPIANTQVYICGAGGEPLPVGIAGEICIGGAGVALGYHERPDLTAQRFTIDSRRPDSGLLYKTGDRGRWRDDGRLEHLGRLDQQVKVRGFRVELGEIESVLGSMPAVRQAVVVARDASPTDRRLVAYIVYQPGEDLTPAEVRRHLRGVLPDYMVPALMVAVDAIPLTANGKVDRAALPDPFRHATVAAAAYEPPASPMERLLADIWAEVLGIERVGAQDNFFELGGHSLLSLRVATAVEKRSGWHMDPRTLFFQTLRQIAATGRATVERSQASA